MITNHELYGLMDIPERLHGHRIFVVPAGMGDFAWLYAKLCNLKEKFVVAVPYDHSAQTSMRSVPFLKLLPQVEYQAVAYTNSNDVARKYAISWNGRKLPALNPAILSCNHLLEVGKKLDEILPDMPTTRHFEMIKPKAAEREADDFVGVGEKAIAIYPSSERYFGKENLAPERWAMLADFMLQAMPEHKLVMVGALWDMAFMFEIRRYLQQRGQTATLVYDKDIATVLAVLRRCKLLVGAVSGLTIVSEYQKIPTLHLYPPTLLPIKKHNELYKIKLKGTWETPEMVERGTSISIPFQRVQHIAGYVYQLIQAV